MLQSRHEPSTFAHILLSLPAGNSLPPGFFMSLAGIGNMRYNGGMAKDKAPDRQIQFAQEYVIDFNERKGG